ncbi:MAG: hypothetical protein RLZZ488_2248 [Pseudomonadota bacterium]|jgi:hypothetical protein
MSGFSRQSAVLSVSLLSAALVSCGSKSTSESETKTVVGRGGALFDKRVQVINALPNLLEGTTCLYVSQHDKSKAPLFSGKDALSSDQQQFLRQAERDARPVTSYPVSMVELDRGLAQKDVERRMRGILLIPTGIFSAYFGFGILAVAAEWSGLGLGIFANPLAYPYLIAGIGGISLINQATRDLSSKNNGLRVVDATANSSAAPSSANLGVTLAYMNVAKSLPAASQRPCPNNLTAESLQPYVQSIQQQYNALSKTERSARSNDAMATLKNLEGCHFSARVGDEQLVYQATPVGTESSTIRLQTYQVKPNVGMQLISDEELKLQMKSDADAGSKYISDNERGSIAIWFSSVSNGKPTAAKLAHKLASGEYVGKQTHIDGSCKL